MNKWIFVDDKMPELNSWVLVYADGAMNCMWYSVDGWRVPYKAEFHNITISNITHWMSLPEAPKNDHPHP